jgi:TP901 family phage tail tape measure protein
MATIKRNVDITYTARGLEEIAAEAKKISLFPVDSTNIDQLQSRIASLRGILAGYPDLLVSPEMAAEFGKEYENIIKMLGKARTDLIATQNEQAAGELQKLQAEIDLIDQNIQEKQDEIEKISKRVKLDPETQLYGTEVKSYRKEVLQQATSALDPEDQMKGITGREIKNADSFVAAMEKVDEVFKNIDVTKQAIFKKMQDGEALTVAELAVLQEQLGKQEAVKLSAQEIAQQYIIRKKILEEEQNIYKKTDGLMKKTREDEIKYLEETKGKFVELKSQIESDVEEGSFLSGKDAEKLKVLNSSLELSSKLSAEYKNKVKDLKEAQKENEAATKDATKATDKQGSTLGKAAKQVFSYGLAFSALRRIYRETIRTITDLDKALTEMAIVTSMNRKEAWNLVGTFQDLAKQTGFTTTEIAKLSTVYFRQGRSLSDVIELTKVAAQAARIAGISAAESANFLTSAVNGFGLAADKALSVSDKFAALAASSASSYEELANGLSKFASQANIAGISIDFAMGMLAKGVETTREAPETIGTAIKTVLARMRELTDLGKTFEDGMDINRVEVALRQVGVQLRDSSGQFRDMEKVLTEIGMKWETLNTNQRASIAVSLAGTRQQSRLIAIMSNFDRTLELVNTSQESAGATTAQQVEYMKSMQAALVGLQTAYQKFITTITDSELVISIVKILSGAIEGIANILDSFGIAGKNAMIALFGLAAAVKLNSTFTKIYNGQL